MKSKRYLYIYIPQVFNMIKSKKIKLTIVCYSIENGLQSPRTIAIIRLGKTGNIIHRHEVVGGIIRAIG
jgi:hypothetical protein